MNFTPISSILISNSRQRQEFDPIALTELMDSISQHGLFHPPVLRPNIDPVTSHDQPFILVSGERRIRALSQLWMLGDTATYNGVIIPENSTPYTLLADLDELQAEEAELDENFRRRDLSWQEHAAAVSRLHDLRTKQKAKEAKEKGVELSTQTVAQTSKEVYDSDQGGHHAKTRKEIIVSQHLSDPDVQKASTLDEGFKILQRKEQERKHVALAEQVGANFSSKSHTILKQDCLEWIGTAIEQGEKFDVICSDPPYGMGAHTFGDSGGRYTTITHKYDDSFDSWVALMSNLIPYLKQITKEEAHVYFFCDIDNFPVLKNLFTQEGWDVFRTPLVYFKNNGRVPRPEHGPRRQSEYILYAIKGNKRVNHIYSDVIQAQSVQNDGHGAQKPVAVYQNLLQRSAKPGDRILDLFAGTGPIVQACHNLRCYCTAIEQEDGAYGQMARRLMQISAGKVTE